MPRGGKREGAGRKPGSHGADRRLFLDLIATMRDESRTDRERLVAASALAEALLPVGLPGNHTKSSTGRHERTAILRAASAELQSGGLQ